MRFKYTGDPKANGHGPDTLELQGRVFLRDEWVDVPDDDPAIGKLQRHSHLQADDGDAADDEKPGRKKPGPKPKGKEADADRPLAALAEAEDELGAHD